MRRFIGCGAAVVALLLFVRPGCRPDIPTNGITHSTAVGEVRHFTLGKGGRVDLGTGSEVRTHERAGGYSVVLTRGEARLRSGSQDHVGLLVVAGNVRVSTSAQNSIPADFSIRRVDASQVDVLVNTGSVDIDTPFSLTLSSGESISLRANSVYARGRLSAAARERRLAWTDGWLWFVAAPLPEAVAEFNRYQDGQPVLVDPRLAALRIGGRFRSSDLDGFIAALEHSFDVRTASVSSGGTRVAGIYLTASCSRASQQCN